MYRASHTLHIPVSTVKTASSVATSSSVVATYSGWIGRRVPTWVENRLGVKI
jgi:hypothetical protein